jgi:hypothetical protein
MIGDLFDSPWKVLIETDAGDSAGPALAQSSELRR